MGFANILLWLLLSFASYAHAETTHWEIIPKLSSLNFIATQNGAPVEGHFTDFTGEIQFDPNQLKDSHIKITVNIAALSSPYDELSATLKSADWFNVKIYPQAIYQSDQLVKTGDNTYQAKGMLTLRDKTLPVTIQFTQQEFTTTHAKMTGTATIKRTAFGVGQGEWADTKSVQDNVELQFTVDAIKK